MNIMPMNRWFDRKSTVALAVCLALGATSASPAMAAPASQASKAQQASAGATDFSAAKRRHYRRGPNAAGLAFMGVAAGLIGGAIAESQRREYYENRYYYGPRPYYGGPGYYGGGPYYDGGYYRPRYYYQPY